MKKTFTDLSPASVPVTGSSRVKKLNASLLGIALLWLAAAPPWSVAQIIIPGPSVEKWSQPPVATTPTNWFYGWNEFSMYGGGVAADDWVCTNAQPVTHVRWWGSFLNWVSPVPPLLPVAFQMAIWTDVPAGVTQPFSHPGTVVWTNWCTNYTWKFVGWDYDPRANRFETCFEFEQPLPQEHWFYQEPGPTGTNIYWLSLAAVAPQGADFPWGWKTRPRQEDSPAPDDAVRIHDPTMPELYQTYVAGSPIFFPDPTNSWDLAFELESRSANRTFKWEQLPDLRPGFGVDINDTYSSTMMTNLLADDFLCTQTGPLTNITIWASWYQDFFPGYPPTNVIFTFSIHKDYPLPNPYGYSMPGSNLWLKTFSPGQYICTQVTTNVPEGWWNPPSSQQYYQNGDTMCFRYDFTVPAAAAFVQQGSSANPMIYWLDMQVQIPGGGDLYRMGWKTSVRHWNDAATWVSAREPYHGPEGLRPPWTKLIYPPLHPMYTSNVDLAFRLNGVEQQTASVKWSQPPVLYQPANVFNGWNEPSVYGSTSIVADDWGCTNSKPVSDIHWWGSFVGWSQMFPPLLPNAFHMTIWNDVPAGVNEPYSHPEMVLWENRCTNFTWQFVGWDLDPRDPNAPPEACFRFDQDLSQEDWFSQEPGTNIYWISIAAVYSTGQSQYPWGWKTRPHFTNALAPDAAITIDDPTAPHLGDPFLSGAPLWWPDASHAWDTAFVLTTRSDSNCVVVVCPSNMVVSCTPANGAVVNYTAYASNFCTGTLLPVTCVPASGSVFPPGTTQVCCTNITPPWTNYCCFSVTVFPDTNAPTITCPSNIVVNTDAGLCSKSNVTFVPTARDDCPNLSVICVPASGSTFAKGVRTVVCTATDIGGNTANCTFTVTVLDLEPPKVTCPNNITANSDPGQCSKSNVTYTATATDNCPGVSVACVPPSGSTFWVGVSTVICTAQDAAGNTASCSFTVMVTGPPWQLACSSNKVVTACKCDGCLLGTNEAAATMLRHFTGNSGATPGSQPMAGLLLASDGMLYGTTWDGGNNNAGTVYRVNTDGSGYQVLHHFTNLNTDGRYPHSQLVEDQNGMLYGTTARGGTNDYGTVFKMGKSGSPYTILRSFPWGTPQSFWLYSALLIGRDGLLYGTTLQGGTNSGGTVFRMDTGGGGYAILHHFPAFAVDGKSPNDDPGLVQGPDGTLYGTTFEGGSNNVGTVFMLSTNGGGYTILHHFLTTGNDGQKPWAGLLFASDGLLYGTTSSGGTGNGGTVFRLDPTAGAYPYGYTKLHDFTVAGGDGQNPYAGLVEECCGALWGTTVNGGPGGNGAVFKLNKDGSGYKIVHSFNASGLEGRNPHGDLVFGVGGMVYGTARYGGSNSLGTIFALDCGWDFDQPTVVSGCCVTVTIVSTVSNGPCPQSFTRTWLASDCLSNTATCSQTVWLVGTNPPVIQCPGNIVITACSNVPVFYNVTASSICCSNVTVVCTPPSGSVFAPNSTTTVQCQAWDCCGDCTNCSFTVTVQCPAAKWIQWPDITFMGLDVWDEYPLVLADDFLCTQSGLITNLFIWGSRQDDIFDPTTQFYVSFWSDVPASNNVHSHPGKLLWTEWFGPGYSAYQVQFWTNANENFFYPGQGIVGPDTMVWRYDFFPRNPFRQQGTSNNPVIYWVSVSSTSQEFHNFGWKTSTNHWNDDAVYAYAVPGSTNWQVDAWRELRDPRTSNSLDLAFGLHTFIDTNPPTDLDFGDAPDSVQFPIYPTLLFNNGARHVIVPGFNLGNLIDAEANGQPNANASGDNANGLPDEDGVVFNTPLIPGQWAQVTVTATAPGWLNAWIDFGRDGSWAQGGDQIFAGQPLNAGANVLPCWVPASAVCWTNSFARFRFSSVSNLTYTGLAPDGEVEDYQVFLDGPGADLGDAPDSSNSSGLVMTAYPTGTPALFPTVYLTGSPPYGPIHFYPAGRAFLGLGVSPEAEADIGCDQDGVNNINPLFNQADLDGWDNGVVFPLTLQHCTTSSFKYQVNVVAPSASTFYVNVWFDWNRDGDWSDTMTCQSGTAPEWAVQNQPVSLATAGLIPKTTPLFRAWHPTPGTNTPLWMRITLSEQPWGQFGTDGGCGPATGYLYGETEDYYVTNYVEPMEFGDAPDRPYPTLLNNDGARHLIIPGIRLGKRIDAELNGQPHPTALGDDNNPFLYDDEDGVVFLTQPLPPGQWAWVCVTVSSAGFLNAWVDFGADGVWGPGDQIFLNRFLPAAGTYQLYFPVPLAALRGANTFARFRFSTMPNLGVTGLAPNGEVEDYMVRIQPWPTPLPAKWLQNPDATTNGLDVKATWSNILADDFLCRYASSINGVTVWGSWSNDVVDPNARFLLGLWTDTPRQGTNWSRPRQLMAYNWFYPPTAPPLLWRYQFGLAANAHELFYDPNRPGTNGFIGTDTQIWRYEFYPRSLSWRQYGSPWFPRVYWLSLTAQTRPGTLFGWKTSTTHWNDDGVFGHVNTSWVPLNDWKDLRDPRTDKSLDLAFAIRTFKLSSVNKDFWNLSPYIADGVEVELAGAHTITWNYVNADTWTNFVADTNASGNTVLRWSGGSVPPGGQLHVGFEIPGTSVPILRWNWTTSIGALPWSPWQIRPVLPPLFRPRLIALANDVMDPPQFAVVSFFDIEYYDHPVPLDQLNQSSNREPIRVDHIILPAGLPLMIPPGDTVNITNNLPPPPNANHAVFVFSVSPDVTGGLRDASGTTTDFMLVPLDRDEPTILAAIQTENTVEITWQAMPGHTYRLKYKNTVDEPVWFDEPDDVTAGDDTASKTIIMAEPQRFYRVFLVEEE